MKQILEKLQQIIARREKAALCIVVNTQGSTPLKAGAKMIVAQNGQTHGTIGGGELEHQVIRQAGEMIDRGEAATFEHHLVKDHRMCCGGKVTVYIEPVTVPHPLYLFGAGHVSKAVVEHLRPLEDFEITVVDDRPHIFNGWNTNGLTFLNRPVAEALPTLEWGDDVFAVIMTYSHPLDREILAFCLQQETAYTGMIGSQRKALMTRKLFIDQQIATAEQMHRVDVPIGIDIGAHSPQEIAISIAARLISVKNKGAKPGRKKQPAKETGSSDCLSNEIISFHKKQKAI